MFRPEIKVLDATIRDGGLMNNWDFDLETVRRVYRALAEAGIDYMEIGYRNSRSLIGDDAGLWRYCDEEQLRRVVDGIYDEHLKLSAMIDIGRVEEDEIPACEDSLLDMIRVATYVKDVDKAIYLANSCHDKGYETTINIMAISHALERDLDEALLQIEEETKCKAVYIVDSFGSLYSEQVHYLVMKYHRYIKTKEVGFHAHNNQQLGFANTIEAIIKDANYLDATLFGIGRAAGNCPLELLISFLKNPKFDLRPLLQLIAEIFAPMQKDISWGYHVPYMITGAFDEHPRAAMKLMQAGREADILPLYDSLLEGGGEV